METKAKISNITRDFESGKVQITFTLDHFSQEEVERLMGKDIRLKAVIWREKRSLNANAYFHVLVGKLAEKRGTTHTWMHNYLISEYGYIDEDIRTIILDDEIDWLELESLHLKPTTATKVLDNGRLHRVYYVMRGSHTYDSKEMARLIDGTIEDCKGQGIETITPNEKARMLATWEAS